MNRSFSRTTGAALTCVYERDAVIRDVLRLPHESGRRFVHTWRLTSPEHTAGLLLVEQQDGLQLRLRAAEPSVGISQLLLTPEEEEEGHV